MSDILVEVGPFVGVSQAFCERPLCERLLFNLSILLILILHGTKVFWRALLAGRFFINIWYWINGLLNINSALAIQRGLLHR